MLALLTPALATKHKQGCTHAQYTVLILLSHPHFKTKPNSSLAYLQKFLLKTLFSELSPLGSAKLLGILRQQYHCDLLPHGFIQGVAKL